MNYISTRGNSKPVVSAEAIKTGMVPAGGLFVPESIPHIDANFISSIKEMDYKSLSKEILKLFLSDYSNEEIKECVEAAYNNTNFAHENIAPLVKVEDTHILELWHGPTAAFKDMALQILPRFLVKAMQKTGTSKEVVILVATSGDTGKAALEGFKNVPGTKIVCFYPHQGVSKIQELQMTTTDGNNTYVVAVEGNFDDCQTAVKNIFGDKNFTETAYSKGFELSSANSINWGRLVPQIVYYFWAYAQLLKNNKIKAGDEVNVVVPTGNFGNILAAYYAFRMGLPIKKFICASNRNNVLTDFLTSGKYDKRRTFFKTVSPSMDILISSNLERFLFEITGHNVEAVAKWIGELSSEGYYTVDEATRKKISSIMVGGYADEKDTANAISTVFQKTGYVLDPHTAVAYSVYRRYTEETKDATPAIITATANPYKFNAAVLDALMPGNAFANEFEMVEELHRMTGLPIHRALENLQSRAVMHSKVSQTEELPKVIKNILNI